MAIKIGLDIHGTADAFPEFFKELTKLFINAGHEIHIMTGQRREEVEDWLKESGISFTHFFSITDHHEKIGTEMNYGLNGNPWMDEKIWNETKGEYAKRAGIDMMFENSDDFRPFFDKTVGYLKVME